MAYLMYAIQPGNDFKRELKILLANCSIVDVAAMKFPKLWYTLILTTINLILFYDLIMYILMTLSNIYTLLMDDIDMSEKDLPK